MWTFDDFVALLIIGKQSVTREDEVFGAVGHMNAGKIVFGEPDLLQTIADTEHFNHDKEGQSFIIYCYKSEIYVNRELR